MPELILAGGGHAHILMLGQLAARRPPDTRITLVSSGRWQYYSGMMPGWVAGDYRTEECRIDLQALCRSVGCHFRMARVSAVEPGRRRLRLAGGEHLDYDWLSLATGSAAALGELAELGPRLLALKPWVEFVRRWPQCLARAQCVEGFHLAVVGGGAAAVEVALAARQRLPAGARVTLIHGDTPLLGDFNRLARHWVRRRLQRCGVEQLGGRARAIDAELQWSPAAPGDDPDGCAGAAQPLAADLVIAATGARAPEWLADSGLRLDPQGYLLVDPFQRSVSDARIFAAGDVCSRVDGAVPRSGVQAVRAAPLLAHNLLASLEGRPLWRLRRRRRVLSLLACGGHYGVAAFGPLAAAGGWVWRWKDHIDRGFVRRFAE